MANINTLSLAFKVINHNKYYQHFIYKGELQGIIRKLAPNHKLLPKPLLANNHNPQN